MAIQIDDQQLCKRLKAVYDSWKTGQQAWSGATALAVPVGSASDVLRYLKGITVQLWLFGYELPDTILVFTASALHVLTSSKKASLLEQVAGFCKDRVGVDLVLHVKPKSEDGRAQIQELVAVLEGATVGVFAKETAEGKLASLWYDALAGTGRAAVDITPSFADLLACKDTAEITNVKKAAFLSSSVMKNWMVPELEGIVDEEKRVKHSRLSERLEEVITDPSKINIKLKAENVDIAYPPIVQSGGNYDLKVSAQSDDRVLQYDVILCSLGARYSMYCANVARTYLVDPNKVQEAEYKALLAAQEAALRSLTEGASLAAPYHAAVKALQEAGQDALIPHLTKNVGFGMGLEFREGTAVLNSKNTNTVKAGMVFNVAIGAADLRRTDADEGMASTYALVVADTVLVPAGGGAPEVLTAVCPKAWTDVAYYFKDNEAGEQVEEERPPAKFDADGVVKKTMLRSEDQNFKAQEETRRKQKENQEELLKRVNEETLRQLTHAKGSEQQHGTGRKVSEVVAYRSINEVPPTRDLAIQVDQKNECVLVPIYGVMVPFHILTVKNASNNQDGSHAYIRLNFNFGATFEPSTSFPNAMFLKELSFRSADTRHAAKVVQEIKVLRSAVSQRERENAERATLVQQERLIKAKGRMYTLPDVWIRPPFGGKGRKMTGQLEAHANGFRYTTPKGESLDIMYRNIKHAFFQPAENEMITLVHLHLIDSIMVGKKKTQDVQFYTEVMDSVQTLDVGRRSAYDPDEIEEEQRERELRNKINRQFQQFVKRVQQDVWERDFGDLDLEFEIPFRELGFMGVPHRTTAFVMPTVNCLVELIEMPFTVITMTEVNLVNLERVGFGLRNFDMTIVFKDLTRDVVRIDAIRIESLETIKEWLGSMDIKFYESKINLNWKPILKSIQEDPEGFIAEGGWSFLDQEGGDSEGEAGEESEDDAEFAPSGSEEEAESSEDASSEDESLVDSDEDEDEEEEAEEDEEGEEGLSWEELEEEAIKEDRAKHYSEGETDDENDRKRKRKGGGGPAAPAAKKRGRR
ncbi:hypothetical protein WJX72_011424 [[Myrmecia] bisecta]|uniref:FACT complex subunit n=1 Tax=[Myrmecia] bisecta TaxID=41462 RepID=A0AAW1QT05_9CHLO